MQVRILHKDNIAEIARESGKSEFELVKMLLRATEWRSPGNVYVRVPIPNSRLRTDIAPHKTPLR
jgi:hypothetical protein